MSLQQTDVIGVSTHSLKWRQIGRKSCKRIQENNLFESSSDAKGCEYEHFDCTAYKNDQFIYNRNCTIEKTFGARDFKTVN